MLIAPPTPLFFFDKTALPSRISWTRAFTELQRRPTVIRDRAVTQLLKTFGDPDPDRKSLAASDDAESPDRLQNALLAAAASGALRTYVVDLDNDDVVHEINMEVWRGTSMAVNPQMLAATGQLMVYPDFVAARYRAYSSAPIFLDRSEFERLMLLDHPISERDAMAQARRIVAEVVATRPTGHILKSEFWRSMKERCGRINKKILERVWRSDAVPAAWHAPGRRRS